MNTSKFISLASRWLTISTASLGVACASYSTQRYTQTAIKSASDAEVDALAVAKSGAPAPPTAPRVVSGDCELRLYIEQEPSHGTYGVAKNSLGVAAVERDAEEAATPTKLRDGICVKRIGTEIHLPSGILVAVEEGKDGLERFCSDDVTTGIIGGVSVEVCTWNGRFHAARPFTFSLVSAPGTSVGDLVEFARIYRNGELVAAWNRTGDQKKKNEVVFNGDGLRSHFFAASQPPHLSDLDIRIIPRDTSITETVEMTVRDDVKRMEARARAAGEAAVDEELPKSSPARQSLECLKKAVSRAKAQILKTVNGKVQIPDLTPGCDLPLGATAGTPLSDAYAEVKNQARSQLVEYRNQADARLVSVRQELGQKFQPAVAKALEDGAMSIYEKADQAIKDALLNHMKKLGQQDPNSEQILAVLRTEGMQLVAALKSDSKTQLSAENVKLLISMVSDLNALAKDIDKQVQAALATVDEAHALANTLYDQAVQIVSSPARQAQIFDSIAKSLQAQGDVFEPRRDNPPLLLNEQKITMVYSDHWQTFMLAPWNGMPIRIGGHSGADFNAAIAVPLLDVMGLRYQWGKNRFTDVRAAVGIGYTLTDDGKSDGSSSKEPGALPNASLGIANFKFGVGIVTGKNVGTEFHDRWRFILGADLYKLITGSNVEAF